MKNTIEILKGWEPKKEELKDQLASLELDLQCEDDDWTMEDFSSWLDLVCEANDKIKEFYGMLGKSMDWLEFTNNKLHKIAYGFDATKSAGISYEKAQDYFYNFCETNWDMFVEDFLEPHGMETVNIGNSSTFMIKTATYSEALSDLLNDMGYNNQSDYDKYLMGRFEGQTPIFNSKDFDFKEDLVEEVERLQNELSDMDDLGDLEHLYNAYKFLADFKANQVAYFENYVKEEQEFEAEMAELN